MKKAKDTEDGLLKALGNTLDVDPKDVSILFETHQGDHVLCKMIVTNPSKTNKELCHSKELPRKLRDKINEENILPNQECNKKILLFIYLPPKPFDMGPDRNYNQSVLGLSCTQKQFGKNGLKKWFYRKAKL